MSRNAKIILFVIGGAAGLILCLCAAVYLGLRSAGKAVEKAISYDPTQVAQVAAGIATFQLPPGYQAAAMDFFGLYRGIVAQRGQGEVIMLVQIPGLDEQNQEGFRQQLEQNLQAQAGGQNYRMQLVQQAHTTIRGQKVLLTVFKGVSDDGDEFRSLFCAFPGEEGMVMLAVLAPLASWDVKELNRFINSIQ
jgi:hypothetical protein